VQFPVPFTVAAVAEILELTLVEDEKLYAHSVFGEREMPADLVAGCGVESEIVVVKAGVILPFEARLDGHRIHLVE